MDYAFAFQGVGYTPSGAVVDPAQVEARNAAIEVGEVERWAGRPASFTGYVEGDRFTTWRGVVLGRVEVTSRWLARPPQCKQRHPMMAVRVHGSNGAVYGGSCRVDGGGLCRVTRRA